MTSSSVFALIAFKKLVKCEKWGKCLQGVPTSLRFCENLTFFAKSENLKISSNWSEICVAYLECKQTFTSFVAFCEILRF